MIQQKKGGERGTQNFSLVLFFRSQSGRFAPGITGTDKAAVTGTGTLDKNVGGNIVSLGSNFCLYYFTSLFNSMNACFG
jgi:hypothetical protein